MGRVALAPDRLQDLVTEQRQAAPVDQPGQVVADITQDAVIDGTAADGAADLIARADVALLSGDARLAADLLIKASGR